MGLFSNINPNLIQSCFGHVRSKFRSEIDTTLGQFSQSSMLLIFVIFLIKCNILYGIFLVDDSQTPPSPKKCLFSKIDFLDVSDDFAQKKIFGWKKNLKNFIFFFSVFFKRLENLVPPRRVRTSKTTCKPRSAPQG